MRPGSLDVLGRFFLLIQDSCAPPPIRPTRSSHAAPESLFPRHRGRLGLGGHEYPVGSTQRVFYKPEDPSVACLERGGSRAFLGYGWSILFALLAIGLVVGLVLR